MARSGEAGAGVVIPRARHALLTLALMLAPVAALADTVDARCDIYPKGSDRANAVIPCTFSQRQGFIGIQRADGVRHDLTPRRGSGNYTDELGRPVVRTSGLGRRGMIFRFERETVYVYWDTAGLPGGPTPPAAKYTPPPAKAGAAASAAFDRTFSLQGIGFRVQSPNRGATNRLEITTTGLTADNSPIVRDIDGRVTGAEVADLDADGSPEIYVYTASAGSGSYGSVHAFSANRKRSLSEIFMPPLEDQPGAAKGYMGHDEFAVVESSLARRFPIYRDNDSNATPTGGMRQIQYKLRQGEASWVLRVERVVEY